MLICWLLWSLFGFEGLIDHGAYEVVQAGITLRAACGFVYRGLRVGTCAAGGRELGLVTLAVVGEQGEGFLLGEEIGIWGKDGDGFFGFFPTHRDKFGIEDLFGHKACLAEAVEMLLLCALWRVFLVVTGVAEDIRLLHAFVDNTTVIGAVFLLSIDDAFSFDCAVDFTDGVFKDNFCHIAVCFLIRHA